MGASGKKATKSALEHRFLKSTSAALRRDFSGRNCAQVYFLNSFFSFATLFSRF